MKPVIDFDQHGPAFAADWRGILKDLRANNPLAWTEAHGGYWVATKYDDIVHMERTPEVFSCHHDMTDPGGPQGIRIPPSPFHFQLNESDPPKHTGLRALEQPFFTPERILQWKALAQRHADEQLDRMLAKAEGDLVEDYTIPMPARTTLKLIGVPDDDWPHYMAAALSAFLPTDHPDYPVEARIAIGKRLKELMALRREEPRDDVISALTHAEIDGEPLPEDVALSMLMPLAFGGFDTTAATAASAIHWLEDKPHLHDRLIEDDAFLSRAVDEWLRYFTPVTGGLARNVVRETELRGQTLRPGERVLMMFASGNYDEDRFAEPDKVDLDRHNAKQHIAFGVGRHRCIGMVLGHAEIGIMVRSFLGRMKRYRIDHARAKRFPTMGLINGWLEMPVACEAR
ncbi:MAG: cytochrome P450 [Novosphingobium sp.]|nr:cytochrome P450 [Novosphingobium sp.]